MNTVIIVNSETFGKGDETLGISLIGAFLRKIWANEEKPQTIIFYNSGVKHLGPQSTLLEVLHGLEEQGVELVACGTCIDHYGLKEVLQVGRRTDMAEIVHLMMTAEKTITV
ncbi:sulfurtransferase-like selenium metabolism protein YedF [Sporanaerobium hydrogeniformans]|uniref:Sulfurtransferase-like selenium metabolism protein YedF n=2 Tax=Sporanaerobium hydrogeniformans TaxID=3072179 RepID=A0AC61DH66_9FIRM|nr:sulfurtransferase-like selenium metabolism protein YedF [Sporanaerobium hydrogeniformans]